MSTDSAMIKSSKKIKSKWDKKDKKPARNFLKENALKTSHFEEKISKFIRDKYKGAFNLNIP